MNGTHPILLYLDIIDPAMLRPGRLDKVLYVGLPSAAGREAILRTLTQVTLIVGDIALRVMGHWNVIGLGMVTWSKFL